MQVTQQQFLTHYVGTYKPTAQAQVYQKQYKGCARFGIAS